MNIINNIEHKEFFTSFDLYKGAYTPETLQSMDAHQLINHLKTRNKTRQHPSITLILVVENSIKLKINKKNKKYSNLAPQRMLKPL